MIHYVCTSGDSFIKPIMERLGGEPITEWPPPPGSLAWLEWADQASVDITRKGGKTHPIVLRFHSYEAFTDYPNRIDWRKVDTLIFVADHVREYALAKFPKIEQAGRILTIPNGIDFEKFKPGEKTHGRRIAWAGGISNKKGPQLFVQVVAAVEASHRAAVVSGTGCRSEPPWEFHVAGEFQDPRYEVYLRRAIERGHNIVLHGNVEDMASFYADKDYILSTSPWESFQYAIGEGIACGCYPLIHDWPGARNTWGVDTWWTVADLLPLLNSGIDDKRKRMLPDISRYDFEKVYPQIEEAVRTTTCSFPTIGASMIVKGGETDRLRKALESIDGHVDELVVKVDTRSGTEAIGVAESFGATVISEPSILYRGHFDFSSNRNRALEDCSTDWCLFIDADEELNGVEHMKPLVWAAEQDGYDGIAMQVNCFTNSGLAEEGKDIRLFKNGGMKWRYPAHNQLTGMTKTMGVSNLVLRSSYEGKDALKHRCERTVPILEMMWENAEEFDDPEDARDHAAFFLCRMFAAAGDHAKTIEWGDVCRERIPKHDGKSPFWTWLTNAWLLTEGDEPARAVIEEGLGNHPEHGDLLYLKMALDIMDWGSAVKNNKHPGVPMHSRQHADKLEEVVNLLRLPIRLEEA